MTDDRNWDGNVISVTFYQVKLYLGPLAGELAAELPFTLMHPKVRNYFYNFTFLDTGVFIPCWCCWYFQPEPEPERKNSLSEKKSSSPNHNGEAADAESGHVPSELTLESRHILLNSLTLLFSVDTNLIQLDTDDMASNTNTYADNDDDLIFEVGCEWWSNLLS